MTLNIDFQGWMDDDRQIDYEQMAVLAWRRIKRDPHDIVFKRAGTSLSAQTVRIEAINTARDESSVNNTTGVMRSVVFGVVGHPDSSVQDTDIQRGDRFVWHGTTFEVSVVDYKPGEIQAHCAVRSA